MASLTIAQELTCPVCLEFYKDPRLLPCHHSLCKSCLVALHSKNKNNTDCELQCPSCRHLFQVQDETHIESLPKNFTLASIVCKFQESVERDEIFPCDVCEEGQKERALKKCLQCQLHYCRMCLEQLHPKREALANHQLVLVMDSYGDEHEHKERRFAFLSSVYESQSVATQKCEQLGTATYCMSCDEICTNGDQTFGEGNHGNHDTTEIQTAYQIKRVEFECILARLMDEDLDLERRLTDVTSLRETIQKMVEEKKIELAQEVERRRMTAEDRIEEEMKMRITTLESHLHELEDLKAKTKIKIAAFSELSSFTNDDPSIFLIKLKELQKKIEPVTHDFMKQATVGIGCDSSLPIELSLNEIIANAMQDICPSERRLQIPESNPVGPYMSSKEVSMAIKITSVQQEGTMSADVEWAATDQVDHYEISYFCDPGETVLRPNIVTNRCRLTSLKWDSEYTIKVTAYLPDGKTSFDSVDFKTDPKVKDNKPAIRDISPKRVKLAVTVTNVQKAGMMSADVQWSVIYPASQYQISYSCSPDETVLLKKITENRCRLANLRWDSTYTIKVTTQLDDGTTVFDQQSFKTDPEVKCFPMAVAEICSEKIDGLDSFDEFTASNRIKKGVSFNKIGEFSGIVLTPVLTEHRHFWRMNIDLSIFEEQSCKNIFLDFGIITYSNLKLCTGLTNNKAAYSCTILQKKKRKICLEFHNPSSNEGRSYPLPVNLYQKSHFSYGFLYDKIKSQFAIMDCQSQEVLHVFHNVYFPKSSPIFAICPYHTECKMRVRAELYYMHCINEDVSSWMRKIAKF